MSDIARLNDEVGGYAVAARKYGSRIKDWVCAMYVSNDPPSAQTYCYIDKLLPIEKFFILLFFVYRGWHHRGSHDAALTEPDNRVSARPRLSTNIWAQGSLSSAEAERQIKKKKGQKKGLKKRKEKKDQNKLALNQRLGSASLPFHSSHR